MIKYKLPNGLRVILTPQKETKAVTVLVLVGVGSRYETQDIRGMAHFLEHMMFKGTKKRPNMQIFTHELDAVGAQYNAYTSKDHTGYWIKLNSEHLELALDMLSDMIWNAKLEEQEIRREKGTILEEINMYEDRPQDKVEELAEKVIFQEKHTLGWEVAGLKKTVKSIDRQKMQRFKNSFYLPKNMVVSVAGNFKNQEIKKLIDKYFDTKKTDKKIKPFEKFKKYQTQPQILLEHKSTEQAHLTLSFLGPKYSDKDYTVAQVLSNILSGGFSSRLYSSLRERYGLCYWINSSLSTYQDTGSLIIEAGLDKKRIDMALKLILKEIKKIKNNSVDVKELNKAKENLKGRLVLSLENSSSVATWYANQELLIGKTKSPEEKIRDIMKVTSKDVQKCAQKIFQNKNMNLAIIGPYKDKNKFLNILKI
jgi:predicted Zn-dependent peptidase